MEGVGPAAVPVAGKSAAEQAIAFLLSRNYLLTALELLLEAGEAGLENEVHTLHAFFRDPTLFPPEAVAACNPEGAANFVALAQERQEKLSLLQYELAVAQEDVAVLRRWQQQEAMPGSAGAAAGGQQPTQVAAAPAGANHAEGQLTAAQLGKLNRSVVSHLHAQGFKLAAMTLSKEAQLPPAAASSQAADSSCQLAGWYLAAQQLGPELAHRQQLEEQAGEQQQQLSQLQQQLQASRQVEQAAAAELEFVRVKLHFLEQQLAMQQQLQQQAALWMPEGSPQAGAAEGQQQQQLPPAFTAMGAASALAQVAACMPKVLPHLLINRRDELVPALMVLCQEHPEAAGRRQQAGLLFTLIKKPNVAQRSAIVVACVGLTRRIGGPRAMLDLLPHLEEQVEHELLDRRLLVAEAAGALAPHLPQATGAAAVLKLLGVLLHDPQPQVRCQAVSSLACLLATLGQEDSSSTAEALQLLLAAAGDSRGEVTQLILQSALPAMLACIGGSELLVTQLLPQTLARLHRLLEHCPASGSMLDTLMDEDGTALMRAVPAAVQSHAATLLQLYMASLHVVRTFVLQTQPAWVMEAAAAAVGKHHSSSAAAAAAQPAATAAFSGSSGGQPHGQPLPQQQQASPSAMPNPFAHALAISPAEAFGSGTAQQHPYGELSQPAAAAAAASAAAYPFATHPRQHLDSTPYNSAPEDPLPVSSGLLIHSVSASRDGSGRDSAAGQQQGSGSRDANPTAVLPSTAAGSGGRAASAAASPLVQHTPMNPFALPTAAAGSASQSGSTAAKTEQHLGQAGGLLQPQPDQPMTHTSGVRPAIGSWPGCVEQGPNPIALARSHLATTSGSPYGAGGAAGWGQAAEAEGTVSAGNPLLMDAPAGSCAASSGGSPTVVPLAHVFQLAADSSGASSCLSGPAWSPLEPAAPNSQAANGTAHANDALRQQQATAAAAADPAGVARRVQHDQLMEAAGVAAWVGGSTQLESWKAMEYMALGAVPALVKAALMVAPSQEAAMLMQRLVTAMKATCLAFGEHFAASVAAPQLQAAAGIPDWRVCSAAATIPAAAGCAASPQQQQLGTELPRGAALDARMATSGILAGPASPAQHLAGISCVLPLLLAGVLPYVGAAAVSACLRRLCTDGGSGGGSVWALEHPRAFIAAVRTAAEVQLVQAQLVPVMWDLVVNKQQRPRIAAALLVGAAVPSLYKQQVTRQLLPAINTLASDEDTAVCRAGIAAAATIFACLPGELEVQEALFSTLDAVLLKRGHPAEIALFGVLAPAAGGASSQQLEWLLQRLLLMLAAMHQRGASGKTSNQLAEAAMEAFIALRQIEAHEFTDQRLYMHFVASLTALQREADLLDQSQRDALAAMIEDHEAMMHAGATAAGSSRSGTQQSTTPQLMPPGTRTAALPQPAALFNRQVAPAQYFQAPGLVQRQLSRTGAVGTNAGKGRLAALFSTSAILSADADAPISYFL